MLWKYHDCIRRETDHVLMDIIIIIITLNFVNVHVDMMSYDRSINASGYLYFVRYDRDWGILVMLDE